MKNNIRFDFITMKWRGITREQLEFWEGCFPDVDIANVLTKQMPAWLDANPAKAQKKNWKRFIVNWLATEQKRRDNA